MTQFVTLAHGSVHLPKHTYDAYFGGVDGVVLQRRGNDLLVLPVRHAPAGGYLVKHRNARGDRVIHAGDFLRGHGMTDQAEMHVAASWDAANAGLVLQGLFTLQPEHP